MKRALTALVVAAVVPMLLPGCSGTTGLPLLPGLKQEQAEDAKPEKPAEPTCKTAQACASVLRKLVAQPNRDWIGSEQPPERYADGTRLFAYRALRRKMTCAELDRAVAETRDARPKLQGEALAGTRTLMGKVNTELRAEHLARCRSKGKGRS